MDAEDERVLCFPLEAQGSIVSDHLFLRGVHAHGVSQATTLPAATTDRFFRNFLRLFSASMVVQPASGRDGSLLAYSDRDGQGPSHG